MILKFFFYFSLFYERILLYFKRLYWKKFYTGNKVFLFNTAKILNGQQNKDSIVIGDNTYIRGELFLFPSGGKIQIGDYCYIGEGTKIWSQNSIIIGNHVLISHNVNIHDTNGHPLDFLKRREDYKQIVHHGFSKIQDSINTKPIEIEDDVWIGFNSIIHKGVKIHKRSVVSAGSVVTKDVPPDVVVAGNPAIIIRNIVS